MKTTRPGVSFLLHTVLGGCLAIGLISVNWTLAEQQFLIKTATFPFLSRPIQIVFDEEFLYIAEKNAIHMVDREDYLFVRTIHPHTQDLQRIDVQTEHIIATGAHSVTAFDKQTGELLREYLDRENSILQVQPLRERWVGFYDERSSGRPAIALCDSAGERCEKLLDLEPHCDWKSGTCNDFKKPWGFGASLDRFVLAPDADFRILIFDERGQMVSEILRDAYERLPVTEEFKEQYSDVKRKKSPNDTTQLEFPDTFPALSTIKVADGKIYAATYTHHNGKWECFTFTLDGHYIETVYVPVKQGWPGIEPALLDIKDGKVYELAPAEHQWHLYVSALKAGE